MTRVPTVWDDRYNVEAAPLLSTTKQARVVALARKGGLLDERPVTRVVKARKIFPKIATVHDPAYVQAVRSGSPRPLAQSQGFDWSVAFAESVARIWEGHGAAVQLAAEHRLVLHPVSGAHHAHAHRGGGFCTFNYLVGAAGPHLTHPDDHCSIIDLDAHFGDGTAALIEKDERFSMFDISGGMVGYDHGEDLVGLGLLSYVVQDADRYMAILRAKLPVFLDVMAPTLVQYLAGADPYARDLVGGIKGMSSKRLRERDAFVLNELKQRDIPTVVTLAGGYVQGITERLHVATIEEMATALNGWEAKAA